ncbi:solute carrier family 6 (neurotransmitter transporter, noradrenalin) member 2 [Paragonimus westermani]|uniref:Solute carrier family 6 (Neurotransmitter transporter, noradrenalin) member 2 n=1 Tax=Paragonimus westermani TaxID=34504 RepID=A0A5J4P1N6_9TREM|nr:solute carrier family 6 (neurotransmitter transporter, noradrenalin) member 2 [Paragonimus westermani]
MLQLQKSPGLDDMGPMQWKVLISTVMIFLILYCSMRHGVKSSGKVWSNAAIQIFFSTGAGFGAHIAYATYNPKQYNCYRPPPAPNTTSYTTSERSTSRVKGLYYYVNRQRADQHFCRLYGFLLSGILGSSVENSSGDGDWRRSRVGFSSVPVRNRYFAVGSTLGDDIFPLTDLARTGQWSNRMTFLIVYLTKISLLSTIPYTTFSTFQMGGLESVITALADVAPRNWLKNPYFRQILTSLVLGSACCVALFNARSGGMYLFNLMDRYIAGAALLIGSLFQVIAVAWFYGLDQLCDDIKSMALPSPSLYWRLSWKFITPIVLTIMIVSSVLDPTPLVYNYGTRHPELLKDSSLVVNVTIQGTSQHYVYPHWAFYLGVILSTVSVIMIPLTAIMVIVRNGCHFHVSVLRRRNLCISVARSMFVHITFK